ncbi:MAG: nitroreductase family protein [Verrucomicrobia bacterium]|nr:nitroreductase family protein [Verrucomicrobiota bacterium]
MEVLKAIHERRATRVFSDADVRPAVVQDLLRAAAQAPSALNLQPWSFAVLHGRKRLREYSERAKVHLLHVTDPAFGLDPRIDQYASSTVNIFHDAGTLILICAKPARFAPVEDCFLAGQNLMLAAHGMGLGTCPVGFARPWFNLPEIKAELGLPPGCTPVLPIVVGYPAGPVPPVPRKDPEIACWHWDE